MPTYNFRNTETGEVIELFMSFSQRDQYVKDNPHMETVIGAPTIVGGVGGMKNDSGWGDNLKRIAEAHPRSPLAAKVGGRSSSQAKVSEIADRHFGKK